MSKVVVSRHNGLHVSLRGYITGFVVSIFLTLTSYLAVTNHLLSDDTLVVAIAVLALAQAVVQLYYFLHLGNETRPRWKLGLFLFMVGVILILIVGSLWIMNNLNYHHPTTEQENQYLHAQDGL